MKKKFSLGSAWNVSYKQLYENAIFTLFFYSKVVQSYSTCKNTVFYQISKANTVVLLPQKNI